MKARLIPFVAGAIFISRVASASLIGDFEGGLDGFSNVGTAALSVDGATSSTGNSSLRVTDTGTGWSQSIKVDINSVWASEVGFGGTLSLDIRAAGGAPGVFAWWMQIIPVLNSQNGGWQQLASTAPVLNDQWQTLSWTYSASTSLPGDWAELFFISNSSDLRNYNLDNVRLSATPEPVSGLAAFSAVLPLVSRRRR